MVRVDVDNKNEKVVHHMLLYSCSRKPDYAVGTVFTDGKMVCVDVTHAWAIGGKDFCFPDGVAVEMGGYYVLEVHYDNPDKLVGVQDSSGFLIHYVEMDDPNYANPTLAGNFLVGAQLGSFTIPAGEPNYEVTVTQELKNTEIKIFATMVHGHKLAKKIYMQHGSNDVACDTNYDFDLQEMEPKAEHYTLPAKSTLSTRCVYDASKQTVDTTSGDGSHQEMCIVILMYYPKIDGKSLQLAKATSTSTQEEVKTCGIGLESININAAFSTASVSLVLIGLLWFPLCLCQN